MRERGPSTTVLAQTHPRLLVRIPLDLQICFRHYGTRCPGSVQCLELRWAKFSKLSFEDATRAWEQMIGAKSLERAMEKQSNDAKNSDNWVAEMSKIGEVYSSEPLFWIPGRLTCLV